MTIETIVALSSSQRLVSFRPDHLHPGIGGSGDPYRAGTLFAPVRDHVGEAVDDLPGRGGIIGEGRRIILIEAIAKGGQCATQVAVVEGNEAERIAVQVDVVRQQICDGKLQRLRARGLEVVIRCLGRVVEAGDGDGDLRGSRVGAVGDRVLQCIRRGLARAQILESGPGRVEPGIVTLVDISLCLRGLIHRDHAQICPLRITVIGQKIFYTAFQLAVFRHGRFDISRPVRVEDLRLDRVATAVLSPVTGFPCDDESAIFQTGHRWIGLEKAVLEVDKNLVSDRPPIRIEDLCLDCRAGAILRHIVGFPCDDEPAPCEAGHRSGRLIRGGRVVDDEFGPDHGAGRIEDLCLERRAVPVLCRVQRLPGDDEPISLEARDRRGDLAQIRRRIDEEFASNRASIRIEDLRLDRIAAAVLGRIVRLPCDDEPASLETCRRWCELTAAGQGIDEELASDRGPIRRVYLRLDRIAATVLGRVACPPGDEEPAIRQTGHRRFELAVGPRGVDEEFGPDACAVLREDPRLDRGEAAVMRRV
ncbi:hypothetical protein PSAL_038040 (plasmid) [Pseudooceanicola algae]|uniref:Uncharacterized protein n=1 Tax=Pseudooceanicola algae TaxID=1537215 RepID=A0A7T1BY04_9RHOB|nr:hypothetical protein PSAL_038040 [Pseudooceanicola algae]